MCAATHGVPRILLAYHSQKIGRLTAIGRFHNIADVIDDNATGRYGAHLHDLAAAIHVFSVVTLHRGDTSDAYRDLRALRESLPHQKNCQK